MNCFLLYLMHFCKLFVCLFVSDLPVLHMVTLPAQLGGQNDGCHGENNPGRKSPFSMSDTV